MPNDDDKKKDNFLSEVDSQLLDNYKEEAIANYLRDLGWHVFTKDKLEEYKSAISLKALSDFPEEDIKSHLEENGYMCYEAESVDEVLGEIPNDKIVEHLRDQDESFLLIDPDEHLFDTSAFIGSLDTLPGQQFFELICERIDKDGIQSVLTRVEEVLQ